MGKVGIDVKKTGGNFQKVLQKEARSQGINDKDYQNLEQRFDIQKRLLSNRKAVYDSLVSSTNDLINDYQTLLGQMTSLFAKRVIENRINYLQYYLLFTQTKNWNQRWQDRDEMMAANVDWLLDNLYHNRKVIVVAHNFHLAKYSEKEEVMGEFLAKKYDKDRYVLGVLAGSGSYADNSGKETMQQPVEENGLDIKDLILSLGGQVNFIDIPKKKADSNSFLFEDIIVNDTFIDLSNTHTLVPARHFDGLLLIDRISPPEKAGL